MHLAKEEGKEQKLTLTGSTLTLLTSLNAILGGWNSTPTATLPTTAPGTRCPFVRIAALTAVDDSPMLSLSPLREVGIPVRPARARTAVG